MNEDYEALYHRKQALKKLRSNIALNLSEWVKWYLIRDKKLIDCACDSETITINSSSLSALNAMRCIGRSSEVTVDFAVPRGAAI